MIRLGEKIISVFGVESEHPALTDIKPEEIFFPLAKKRFKREQSGISNLDFHNAVRLGVVSFGSLLKVRRNSHRANNEENLFCLAYIGPSDSFIDPRTRAVSHTFYDTKGEIGKEIVDVSDIIFWKKSGSLTQEGLIRFKRVMDRHNSHKVKR